MSAESKGVAKGAGSTAQSEQADLEVRQSIRAWTGIGIFFAILLGLYALVPYENDGVPTHIVVVFVLGIVLFAVVLGYLVVRNSIGDSSKDRWLRLIVTIVSLVACIIFFSLSYRQLAHSVPTEFVGLVTMIDSLYFTIATTLTVGFGDVYASGQIARLMVIFQMIFTVIVLAAAGRSIAGILQLESAQKKEKKKEQKKARKS